jgi:RNA recognition motif-containing protein
MGSKLYVGNLSYNVDNTQLEQLFSPHGQVQSAEVIADRDTGRSKGFGFVQMGTSEEAQAAVTALNGQEHDGRALTVNEAKPKESRSGNSSGGGRSGKGGSGRSQY